MDNIIVILVILSVHISSAVFEIPQSHADVCPVMCIAECMLRDAGDWPLRVFHGCGSSQNAQTRKSWTKEQDLATGTYLRRDKGDFTLTGSTGSRTNNAWLYAIRVWNLMTSSTMWMVVPQHYSSHLFIHVLAPCVKCFSTSHIIVDPMSTVAPRC